jgi:deoxyribodipyrimidine photo-lyase
MGRREGIIASRREATTTAVVLFTRDLRVHDHPALRAACASADRVAPLFVVDPAVLGQPASANRLEFLAEALADLRGALRSRGGDLFLRRGDTVTETMRVLSELRATTVFLTEDVSRTAQRRASAFARACEAARCELVLRPGTAVVPAGSVVPSGRDHYAVFTPYWRRWQQADRRPVLPAPRRVEVPDGLAVGRLPAVLAKSGAPGSPRRVGGGEVAGRARWARWARTHLPAYGLRRDDLSADESSKIGAYLHFGCLSALDVAQRAAGHEPFERQLCWRDFHGQVTAAFPDLPRRDYRPRNRRWRNDIEAFDAWREGLTGVPVVDAAMRQLRSEGFMPNRARLLVASYLVRDLGLDWRLGAAHFNDWLLDADVANNSGNWQWVAGTGNDTRPNRHMNVIRQARRHDPRGEYVRRHVPELAGVSGPSVHEPWRLPATTRRVLRYPAPLGTSGSRAVPV